LYEPSENAAEWMSPGLRERGAGRYVRTDTDPLPKLEGRRSIKALN
jgi:hypothetical protein